MGGVIHVAIRPGAAAGRNFAGRIKAGEQS
jgi:hypothetical protein